MIFYFTGTGNSGFIAQEVAKNTDDEIISIADYMKNKKELKFTLKDEESIGFVFPVYAWGPAGPVDAFIKGLELQNFKDNYIFAIATCGANIGNTMKIIKNELHDKNMELAAGFSVAMPNNYIIMGDVDSDETMEEKIELSRLKTAEISEIVKAKTKGAFELEKGFLGPILTKIVHPMFMKGAADTSKFFADDKCTGCGKCEKVCTCATIKMENGKPVWGKDCNQCLACIHHCSVHAIQYGKGTEKKGRYINPYFHKI